MDGLNHSIPAVVCFAVVTERYQQWWELGRKLNSETAQWAGIEDDVDDLRLRHAPSDQHGWFLAVARAALNDAEDRGEELTFSRAFAVAGNAVRHADSCRGVSRV